MRASLVLLSVAVVVASPAALAHSGPTEPRTLRALPDGGAAQVMATSFGLLRTFDGASWDVICSEAIGYDENLEPVLLHWAADGALFVGSLKGLFVSRDGACSWEAHPEFASRGVSDVTVSPTSPSTFFVATGKFGASNGLFRSDDSGQSFSPVLTRADTFFTGIRFAPGTPGRAYASAWYFSPPSATLFRTDDGAQFAELAPTTPFVSAFSVVAVSPAYDDHLFASAYDDATGEYVLLRSTDAGASFLEVARDAKAFREVVFSPDGTTMWATAARLFRSTDVGATFIAALEPKRSFCAAHVGEEVHVCADEKFDGFALATLASDGAVTPLLSFSEVRGRLVCPAGTPTEDVCRPLWPTLAIALGVPAADGGLDGGGPDGGASQDGGASDGGTGAEPPDGCGCGAAGSSGLLPVFALLWAAALRRRSRGLGLATVATACALLLVFGIGCAPVEPGCDLECVVPDPCAPNPCSEPGRTDCVNVGGAAQCQCVAGTVERDGACVAPNPCEPSPCTRANETVCTVVDGAASCSCDVGYEPADDGCREIIDCTGQHSSGDAFEPDECPAQARNIGTSGTQLEPHSLEPASDEDWFLVEATAGRIYRLDAAGLTAPPLRANVYFDNALLPVGPERTSTEALSFALKSPGAGPLFFRVRAATPAATGQYQVSIGDLGTDDHGDDAGSATAVALNTIQQGSLQFDDDVDVLSFTPAEAGHSWELRAEAASGATGLRLELLRGTAPDVLRTATGPTASLVTRLTSAEPHFIRLSAPNGGFGHGWSFIAVDLGSDDHGDVPAEATPITPGSATAPANLDRAGDEDVFRFEATPTHIYRFTCTPSGFADCYVTLRDASGAEVASDLGGGVGLVAHELLAGGPHFVHVQTSSGSSGGYTYLLEDLGPDDHGDDPNSATALGMPPVMGKLNGTAHLETSGDRDFLRFTADGDHIYRISCTRKTIGDCAVRVISLAGLVVAQDANGADGVAYYEFLGGGDYYVELSTLGPQTGTMDWEILDLFHDDHGDDAVTATPMLANSAWVQGEIQLPAEKDFFKFEAVAGRQYRVSCQRQSLGDCVMRLYDPGQMVLGQDLDGGDAVLVHTASASGWYPIQLLGSGPQLGTYLVKVEDLGP